MQSFSDEIDQSEAQQLARSRYVPADIKRKLFARASGQCQFVGVNGKRCSSKHQLEMDHTIPWSKGGKSDLDSMQILCRQHNQFRTKQTHGFFFEKGGGNPLSLKARKKSFELLAKPTCRRASQISEFGAKAPPQPSHTARGVWFICVYQFSVKASVKSYGPGIGQLVTLIIGPRQAGFPGRFARPVWPWAGLEFVWGWCGFVLSKPQVRSMDISPHNIAIRLFEF